MAKEAAEAEKKASYQLGVEETEIRLAEELSEVCRDYCNATWDKALTAAGVLVDFALRLLGNIYYHPHIWEIPSASSPSAPIPEPSRQPLVVLDALPPPKGHGRLQAFQTKQPLPVSKEGPCHGKLLIHL